MQPPPPVSLLVVTAEDFLGTSSFHLESHPPEMAGGWGYEDSLLQTDLYGTSPTARTPSSSHIPPIRKLGIPLSYQSHFLTGWWPWADNWQMRSLWMKPPCGQTGERIGCALSLSALRSVFLLQWGGKNPLVWNRN